MSLIDALPMSRAGKSVDRNQVNLPLRLHTTYEMAIFVPTIDLLPDHKGAETPSLSLSSTSTHAEPSADIHSPDSRSSTPCRVFRNSSQLWGHQNPIVSQI